MSVVVLTREARDWLARRGGAVTLRRSRRHGCCGGGAGVAVADAGVPTQPESHHRLEVDGVFVYLAPELFPVDGCTVRLEKLLGVRRLFVDGVDLAANAR